MTREWPEPAERTNRPFLYVRPATSRGPACLVRVGTAAEYSSTSGCGYGASLYRVPTGYIVSLAWRWHKRSVRVFVVSKWDADELIETFLYRRRLVRARSEARRLLRNGIGIIGSIPRGYLMPDLPIMARNSNEAA